MQLGEDEFLRMTYGRFMIHVQGYNTRYEKSLVGHRTTALLLYNINSKKSNQKAAKDFWKLQFVDTKRPRLEWDKSKVNELIEKWTK